MIEIRGVINSPLLAFQEASTGAVDGCSPCTGSESVGVMPLIGNAISGYHVNNDNSNRPQFALIDDYTSGARASPIRCSSIVEDGEDNLHNGCSMLTPQGATTRYIQPPFNVGVITAPTTLAGSSSLGTVDFGSGIAQRLNAEMPGDGSQPGQALDAPRRSRRPRRHPVLHRARPRRGRPARPAPLPRPGNPPRKRATR